jgi:hypothetical protein
MSRAPFGLDVLTGETASLGIRFRARKPPLARYFVVEALHPQGEKVVVRKFVKRADAQKWIATESESWLASISTGTTG